MSERNSRILNIITENMGGYKHEANALFQLDAKIQQKLKTISTKLIPFIIENCKEEYHNLITKYKIVESSQYGSQIIPINKDNQDTKLLNNVEKCVDRFTGLNKLLSFYEVDMKNAVLEDDQCKRKCINDSEKMSDDELIKCLSPCYEKFYTSSLQLANDFEAGLNKINLKLF
jgi:hypothetical protein